MRGRFDPLNTDTEISMNLNDDPRYRELCLQREKAEADLEVADAEVARLREQAPDWWEMWIYPIITLLASCILWKMGFTKAPWLLLFFGTIATISSSYYSWKQWQRRRKPQQ